MNLAYRFPIIYWNTACLSVDASAINAQDFYNLIDDDIVEIEEVEGKRVQNKMDYAKLALALDKFKRICNIKLPDINKSRLSFTPNAENNTILYGLKGISKVTEPVIKEIMDNRPFRSLEDFLNRTTSRVVTKDKVINLIKCGAFDEVEGKTRREILTDFIWTKCDAKKRLTMQNANMLIEKGLFPQELKESCEVYKLTKELRKHRDSNKLWYIGSEILVPEEKAIEWSGIISRSAVDIQALYIDDHDCKVLDSKRWDSFYESEMAALKQYIKNNHDELLQTLNNRLFQDEFDKYCSGDELQWELDSINFFFNGHPLQQMQNDRFIELAEKSNLKDIEINHIEDIIEDAQDGQFIIKGKIIPRMKLFTIIGTVIDRDTTKGLVTVQCPDGVINVKLYKALFALYNKEVKEFNIETGEDELVESSFFDKGTHILITGIQRGATFVPKVYKNTGHKAIMKINLTANNQFKDFEIKENEES